MRDVHFLGWISIVRVLADMNLNNLDVQTSISVPRRGYILRRMVVHAKAYGCAFGNGIKVIFIDFQFCIILLHLSLKFYELVITCSLLN